MQRVLIIQLARFGDLVQCKRLYLTLAARAEVHILVDRSLAELARLIYPKACIQAIRAHGTNAGGGGPGFTAMENLPVLRELSQLDFSEVYNLNYSGLNFSLARMFPEKRVRGYRNRSGQRDKDRLLELAFRWTRRRGPSAVNLIDLWAHLAKEPVAPESVNPRAEPGGGGVGVVLAGRNQRRSLPPEILARSSAALWQARGRGELFLLGTASEARAGTELRSLLPPNVREKCHNMAGRTDWAGLFDILSGLDALLTPDTGTMHLAAHLGVPVEAVFLSSAWAWETGPYGTGHRVWQAGTECAPCLENAPCHEGVRCLEPFASHDFLKALSGRSQEVRGVSILASSLDRLGADYEPMAGEALWAKERAAFRRFLSFHLGVAPTPAPEVAQRFYMERDWMALPPQFSEERL
ncbi:glycosyltransferase family 9 protein [Desulfohalovibrio reitneri]|uniref:glycosyltransferase family 9 protein n=1 Tax=Desulfohalovibrio reitneri TaxID=1307759 RepID=UPI0004A76FE9|nr:glycosyltransferase family 9 protein [Desulfohalovibrio reitneri]